MFDNPEEALPTAQTCSLGCVPALHCPFTPPERKSQGPDSSESLLPPSTAVLPHSLSFWPLTELLSWSWGPPSCQLLLFLMSLWSGRGSGCHRYSCPGCGSGRLACHRCWGLCALWVWLGLKGPEDGFQVAPILGGEYTPHRYHRQDCTPQSYGLPFCPSTEEGSGRSIVVWTWYNCVPFSLNNLQGPPSRRWKMKRRWDYLPGTFRL